MIQIHVDTSAIVANITQFRDQVPFATSLALNRTANAAEAAIRAGLAQRFTIRRPWVIQGVTIKPQDRATKNLPRVTISLDPARSFLAKFEAGGLKTPQRGGLSLALPSAGVRPTITVIVPQRERPRAFQFVKRETRTGSPYTIYEGAQRTFMIQTQDGKGYIFQRRAGGGRGRKRSGAPRRLLGIHGGDPDLVLLYVLEPEGKIPASLEFESTARRVVSAQFVSTFQLAWQDAIKTAR